MDDNEAELGAPSPKGNGRPRGGRKTFTDEFKANAVKQVTDQRGSLAEVARRSDVSPVTVRRWKKEYSSASETGSSDKALATSTQQELERLRSEVSRRKMENDVLKDLVGHFARKQGAVGAVGAAGVSEV